jgi:Mn-dependent DtxR family transcriptional regulator
MEHDLDREVLERLRSFAEFVKRCPHCGRERLRAFQEYYERESKPSEATRGALAAQESE